MDPHSWKRTLQRRLQIVPETLEIIESGLLLAPKNERLLFMRNVYETYNREAVLLLEKLNKIK